MPDRNYALYPGPLLHPKGLISDRGNVEGADAFLLFKCIIASLYDSNSVIKFFLSHSLNPLATTIENDVPCNSANVLTISYSSVENKVTFIR